MSDIGTLRDHLEDLLQEVEQLNQRINHLEDIRREAARLINLPEFTHQIHEWEGLITQSASNLRLALAVVLRNEMDI